ncbi:MAG TPA: hypothetical protein VLJ11_20530, partial [Bryobacteraceae bacterium]|nr:hypothetical protein [Bryobacteraceae bacterium]
KDGFVGWLLPHRFLRECNPNYGAPTFPSWDSPPHWTCQPSLVALWPGYSSGLNKKPSTWSLRCENRKYMPRILDPVQFLLVAIAGWMN